MSKETKTLLLAYHTLSPEERTLIEGNPKAFAIWPKLFNTEGGTSGGSFFQLSKFHEFLNNFHLLPLSMQPMRTSRTEISKDMRIGEDLIQLLHKQAKNGLLTYNQHDSLFHTLDDGTMIFVIPSSFLLGESDIFQVLCYQRKDVFSWEVVSEQLQKLGYIENAESKKYTFFDTEGAKQAVSGVVLTSLTSQYLFGEGIFSVDPSVYLIPTLVAQRPEKKWQKQFLNSSEE